MLSGVEEGYVNVVSRSTREFPSAESAKLYKDLCEGIDSCRGEAYRYDYQVKMAGSACHITTIDIGE